MAWATLPATNSNDKCHFDESDPKANTAIEVFGGMDNHENNVQCGNGQSVIGGDELIQKEAGC